MKTFEDFCSAKMFGKNDVWVSTEIIFSVCWNYSDASLSFAKELVKNGMVSLVALNIGWKPYLQHQEKQKEDFILSASLSILNNLSKVTEARCYFEKANIKQLLQPFLKSAKEDHKVKSIMILVAIKSNSDEDNKMLEDTAPILPIKKLLASAISSKTTHGPRCYKGFSSVELVNSLNLIAANSSYKYKIVLEGCLPLLVNMLQYKDEEEQEAALTTVWILEDGNFWHLYDGKDMAEIIRDEPKMMKSLEELTHSTHTRISMCARTTLRRVEKPCAVCRPCCS